MHKLLLLFIILLSVLCLSSCYDHYNHGKVYAILKDGKPCFYIDNKKNCKGIMNLLLLITIQTNIATTAATTNHIIQTKRTVFPIMLLIFLNMNLPWNTNTI